eukprot:2626016-Rhodomonas_salina.1
MTFPGMHRQFPATDGPETAHSMKPTSKTVCSPWNECPSLAYLAPTLSLSHPDHTHLPPSIHPSLGSSIHPGWRERERGTSEEGEDGRVGAGLEGEAHADAHRGAHDHQPQKLRSRAHVM